jgi:hypothetical protein
LKDKRIKKGKKEDRRSCKGSKRKKKREGGTAAAFPEGAEITTLNNQPNTYS